MNQSAREIKRFCVWRLFFLPLHREQKSGSDFTTRVSKKMQISFDSVPLGTV